MKYEFRFPDVGEGIQEGTIVKWNVKKGDKVKADQTLGDIETDKAVVEIPSPKTGKVIKLHVKQGGIIKVGEVMVTFELSGKEKERAKKDAGTVIGFLDEEKKEEIKEKIHIERKGQGLKAKRSIVQEKSTEGVKITKKYDMFGYVDRIPYTGIKKTIGEHMVESAFTAPQVTHFSSADVTELVKIREKEKENAKKKKVKLTYLPFIVKSLIAALEKHPTLRASLEDEEIIVKKYYNIGIAVDTENGLMVPVLKGADQKSILDIAKEIADLADRAKKRKLDMMDFKGGVFTITNLGVLGTEFFTPILNFPESAILGTGKIEDKVIVKNGKITVRKILPLSLSYDHRITDGAEAARFMRDLVEHIEDPDLLLIEK